MTCIHGVGHGLALTILNNRLTLPSPYSACVQAFAGSNLQRYVLTDIAHEALSIIEATKHPMKGLMASGMYETYFQNVFATWNASHPKPNFTGAITARFTKLTNV